MQVLITGGAGFLGSHLVDRLIADGHNVTVFDNLLTGRLSNISHLKSNPKFSLLQQDVTENFKTDGPIDRIYHLASPASPVAYASHRIETMKVNSQGTWNLLDLSLEKKSRFLVASTSEIYGDPPKNIQREDFWGNVNPIGLRSMYEEAKRFSEACAMAYNRERGADTRIVRIFNTYGPRMHPADGRVVTNFVRQALKDQPITIAGDGTQTRSFCFVSDTVRGLAAVMEADFSEPINIGNPEETPIIQLAKNILELLPESKSKITFEPRADYDPRNRCPDIMRAKQILNWTPKIPLKEGLAKVVEYHRRET